MEEASEVPFGNVQVEFVTEKPPLMTVHEVFSRERTMEEWAGEQSDWATRTDTIAGATFQTTGHRADFPGDVDIEMKAPAEFPANVQLFKVQECAPPPREAKLPVNKQLFSVATNAPPPTASYGHQCCTELPVNKQLFSVPYQAPPPSVAELFVNTQ